ncbi:conjugative transfer signal peptidase TraF [Methylobacter psychrophilus]|uniref:conjugative transfer signal peptidase TraF n=1 Tax=Methylobacter psychrophilus TaxID=96941 RepID=UPI0021D4CCA0|nr:conjugative transfer signal peptidase TraF [Methylobacter psychrophilus]
MKRLTLLTLYAGISVLLLEYGAYAIGAWVNTSNSIPVGLYWLTERPVEKGAYVIFCPPPSDAFDEAKRRGYFKAGFCPGAYQYLMKKVLAVKNDKVSLTKEGVRVNGQWLPFSVPLNADSYGRPLPVLRAEYELGESDVLLMTDVSQKSFDGRYFGPIQRSQILGVIRPIFTW